MQGTGSPGRSVGGAGSGPGTPGQCEAGCQGSGTAGAGTAGNAASVTREYTYGEYECWSTSCSFASVAGLVSKTSNTCSPKC